MNVKEIYTDYTKYYVYIYRDLKGTPIYIGKGKGSRWAAHHRSPQSSNIILHRFLKKRVREGDSSGNGPYSLFPDFIIAKNEEDALEMEELLIYMIGRRDIGTGTLFNLAAGGLGSPENKRGGDNHGRVHSEKTKQKMSENMTGLKRSRVACVNIGLAKAGKPQNTLPCQFCNHEVSKSNLKRHEEKCEKNPNALPRSRANSQAYSMGRANLRSKSAYLPESDQTSGPEELPPQS